METIEIAESHYHGEDDEWILRLSKVVAIKEYVPAPEGEHVPAVKWLIVCEGGYSLDTEDEQLAFRVVDFLRSSNESDERFFGKGS